MSNEIRIEFNLHAPRGATPETYQQNGNGQFLTWRARNGRDRGASARCWECERSYCWYMINAVEDDFNVGTLHCVRRCGAQEHVEQQPEIAAPVDNNMQNIVPQADHPEEELQVVPRVAIVPQADHPEEELQVVIVPQDHGVDPHLEEEPQDHRVELHREDPIVPQLRRWSSFSDDDTGPSGEN